MWTSFRQAELRLVSFSGVLRSVVTRWTHWQDARLCKNATLHHMPTRVFLAGATATDQGISTIGPRQTARNRSRLALPLLQGGVGLRTNRSRRQVVLWLLRKAHPHLRRPCMHRKHAE